MSEPVPEGSPVPSRLHELARQLREAHHLGPEMQTALANLIDELGQALPTGAALTGNQTHLADSTAHLVQALHQRKDAGFLGAAKLRLEEAAVRANVEAPLAAGIAPTYRSAGQPGNIGSASVRRAIP